MTTTFADAAKFGDVSILIGNGDGPPETFTAFIGVQTISVDENFDVGTKVRPRVEDPDAPGKSEPVLKASSPIVATFSGTMDMASHKKLQAANQGQRDGTLTNFKLLKDLTLAQGGGDYTGPAVLSNYKWDGNEHEDFKVSGTLTWSSDTTWTAAS